MATEISEFCVTPIRHGSTVLQRVLPPLRHTSVAVGSVWANGTGTANILITPGEDVRVAFTTDGSAPAPGATTDMLLKAGVPYDFAALNPALKMKAILPA